MFVVFEDVGAEELTNRFWNGRCRVKQGFFRKNFSCLARVDAGLVYFFNQVGLVDSEIMLRELLQHLRLVRMVQLVV